jgi:hypothetical protein
MWCGSDGQREINFIKIIFKYVIFYINFNMRYSLQLLNKFYIFILNLKTYRKHCNISSEWLLIWAKRIVYIVDTDFFFKRLTFWRNTIYLGTIGFNNQKLYVLPAQNFYVFCMNLRTMSDVIPKLHKMIGSCTR